HDAPSLHAALPTCHRGPEQLLLAGEEVQQARGTHPGLGSDGTDRGAAVAVAGEHLHCRRHDPAAPLRRLAVRPAWPTRDGSVCHRTSFLPTQPADAAYRPAQSRPTLSRPTLRRPARCRPALHEPLCMNQPVSTHSNLEQTIGIV